MSNHEDLGGPRRLVIDAEMRRSRSVLSKAISVYVTGTADTRQVQKAFLFNQGQEMREFARGLGIDLRFVATFDDEDEGTKPVETVAKRVQSLLGCNFFIAIIGNDLGYGSLKGSSGFRESFIAAKSTFPWLDDLSEKVHLSMLEVEVHTAMRESGLDRGSFMREIFFTALPHEPVPGQSATEEEMTVVLKRTLNLSGWPYAEFVPEELSAQFCEALGAQTDSKYKDYMPFMEDKALFYETDEEQEGPLKILKVHCKKHGGIRVLLLAPPGVGKSTIIASWLQDMTSDPKALPVVYYDSFSHSVDVETIIHRIIHFVSRHFDFEQPYGSSKGGGALPTLTRMLELFDEALTVACSGQRKLILVLENVHHVSGVGLSHLLRHVKVNTNDGKGLFVMFTGHQDWFTDKFGNEAYEFKVLYNTLATPFSDTDQERFLSAYLSYYFKRMTKGQKKQLCSGPLAGSPLFLRLCCDELMDCPDDKAVSELLHDLKRVKTFDDAYRAVLGRRVNAFAERLGWLSREAITLVQDVLCFIWASRYGANEIEIMQYAPLSGEHIVDFFEVFGKLCISYGNAWHFNHSTFAQYVQETYLPSKADQEAKLVEVARFRLAPFGLDTDETADLGASVPESACMDAIYQLTLAGEWDTAGLALTSPLFLSSVLPERRAELIHIWGIVNNEVGYSLTEKLSAKLDESGSNGKQYYFAEAHVFLVCVALSEADYTACMAFHRVAEPIVAQADDGPLLDLLHVKCLEARQHLFDESTLAFCDKIISHYTGEAVPKPAGPAVERANQEGMDEEDKSVEDKVAVGEDEEVVEDILKEEDGLAKEGPANVGSSALAAAEEGGARDDVVSIGLALAYQTKGMALYIQGDYEEAAKEFDKCASLGAALGSDRLEGQSLRDSAMCMFSTDKDLAKERLATSLDLAMRDSDHLLQMSVLYTQALHANIEKESTKAYELLQQCRKIAAKVPDAIFESRAMLAMGLILENLDRREEATKILCKTVEFCHSTGVPSVAEACLRVLQILIGETEVAEGIMPSEFLNTIGPLGFKPPRQPSIHRLYTNVDFDANAKWHTDLMDFAGEESPFVAGITTAPKLSTIRFVESLVPVHSCRYRDLEKILASGFITSSQGTQQKQLARQEFRDFLTMQLASLQNSWRLDEAAADLLIDHVQAYCLRNQAGETEENTKRSEVLTNLIKQLHAVTFKEAPDRVSKKQYVRVEAAAKRCIKKSKKDQMDLAFSENLWDRDEVLIENQNKTTWGVLGPNVHFGPVSILLNRDVMNHSDSSFTMNAIRSLVSGDSRLHRPWLPTPAPFNPPELEGPLPEPEMSSVVRLSYATLNRKRLKAYVEDKRTQTVLRHANLDMKNQGWKELVGREMKGQMSLRHCMHSYARCTIADAYLDADYDSKVECHMPAQIPADFAEVIIVCEDSIPKKTLKSLRTMSLPDGRPVKDLLVVCKTLEDSIAWQKEYFKRAWELIAMGTGDVERVYPRVGEKSELDEDTSSTRCFKSKESKESDFRIKADQKLRKKQVKDQKAYLSDRRDEWQDNSQERKILSDLLTIYGGS